MAYSKPLVRSFSGNKKSSKGTKPIILFALLTVLAGISTGWWLSGRIAGSTGSTGPSEVAPGGIVNGEAGIEDDSVFKDTAEGTLEVGGMGGEGTHHLVRGDDESQYVYLNSTVINLDAYVGKEVQVWGATLAAQKAPWLMDVGRIKEIK